MPTLENMMIPPPCGWEEFEHIVKSALALRWRTSDLTIHGRQGQKQNGVDIYGTDDLARLVGIQCKLTVNSITQSLVDKEVLNAEGFSSNITALYIATTSTSDTALQQYVRQLSESRASERKFSVGILFWTDILQDLTKDINIVQQHYPQLFLAQEAEQLSVGDDLRQRDVDNLLGLLEYIDIESIPLAIDIAPKSVGIDFLCESDTFEVIRANPSFYIHDEQLSLKLHSWLDKWYEIISNGRFTYNYLENSNRVIFPIPMDSFQSQEESDLYDHLEVLYQEYGVLFNDFTRFIHREYPEINLKETSIKARLWKSQFEQS